jgi:hypothetical protein
LRLVRKGFERECGALEPRGDLDKSLFEAHKGVNVS